MSNSSLTPLYIAPINAALGLTVSVASQTTLSVATGTCMDVNYTSQMFLDTAVVIDAAVTGAAGLDHGTLAASTLYYVYLIADSLSQHATSAMISTSASAPIMPAGYDVIKRIGLALTDGSSHFLTIRQIASGNTRRYYFDTPISVLTSGTSATYALVDLSVYMPVAATAAIIEVVFTPAAAGNEVSLAAGGSTSSYGTGKVKGIVASVTSIQQEELPVAVVSSKPQIQYKVSAGSVDLALVAFDDNIE